MKIIDLLNKIANGEDVPKEIKYNDFIYWEYDEKCKDYKDSSDDYVFGCSNYDIIEMLNDEVEIIEEEKKIPEKIKIDNEDRIQALSTGNYCYKVKQIDKNIIYKINEIIDYLKSKGE